MDKPPPRESLLAGQAIVSAVLAPHGFRFDCREEAIGSGGRFASGEFTNGDRRLEMHYRESLGLVKYHAGRHLASHEAYMRELGVWNQCRYPGFSSEYLQVFTDLAHDLRWATDFLSGTCEVLLRAAAREAVALAARDERDYASAVGDTRTLQQMHAMFKQGRYTKVVALFAELKFPHLLSEAQLRLVQIARQRADG